MDYIILYYIILKHYIIILWPKEAEKEMYVNITCTVAEHFALSQITFNSIVPILIHLLRRSACHALRRRHPSVGSKMPTDPETIGHSFKANNLSNEHDIKHTALDSDSECDSEYPAPRGKSSKSSR